MRPNSIRRWLVLAPVALMCGILLAACGGDDASGINAPGGGGTGSDESYVASLCKAQLKFTDALQNLSKDASKIKNAEDATKLLTGPFEQFAKDVKDANPPKDMKESHDKMTKALDQTIGQIKDGKSLDSLAMLDIEDPPQDVLDRLQKAVDKNEDCQKADFSF